jgi:hypothetical protein
MEQVAKRKGAGQRDIRVDPWQFAEQLASDLDPPLQRALGDKAEVAKVMSVVRRVLRNHLRKMPDAPLEHRAGSATLAVHRSDPLHPALPLDELKPKDVLSAGLVDMSLPSLYRATEQGRFYCLKPRGKSNGRVYPAWQFAGQVPAMLPQVLTWLTAVGEGDVHTRLVVMADELNGLAPAEVLAGQGFCSRDHLVPAQTRLFALPDARRLDLVRDYLTQTPRAEAIG